MWTTDVVQMANRTAVPLLVLLSLAELAMAVGLIPMWLVWGFEALHGSAAGIVTALVLIIMAHIIDKRASEQSNRWIQLAAWLVVLVLVVMVVSNLSSKYRLERWILGTINIVSTICCAIVASSNPGSMTTSVYDEYEEISESVQE